MKSFVIHAVAHSIIYAFSIIINNNRCVRIILELKYNIYSKLISVDDNVLTTFLRIYKTFLNVAPSLSKNCIHKIEILVWINSKGSRDAVEPLYHRLQLSARLQTPFWKSAGLRAKTKRMHPLWNESNANFGVEKKNCLLLKAYKKKTFFFCEAEPYQKNLRVGKCQRGATHRASAQM